VKLAPAFAGTGSTLLGSAPPSFPQLSKELAKGLRGSFIYLVIDDMTTGPLDGEQSIPIMQPSGQKRPIQGES